MNYLLTGVKNALTGFWSHMEQAEASDGEMGLERAEDEKQELLLQQRCIGQLWRREVAKYKLR